MNTKWISTIMLDKIFGKKLKNQAQFDKTRKFRQLLLSSFYRYYQKRISRGDNEQQAICPDSILRFSCCFLISQDPKSCLVGIYRANLYTKFIILNIQSRFSCGQTSFYAFSIYSLLFYVNFFLLFFSKQARKRLKTLYILLFAT